MTREEFCDYLKVAQYEDTFSFKSGTKIVEMKVSANFDFIVYSNMCYQDVISIREILIRKLYLKMEKK